MKICIINPGGISNFGERAIMLGTVVNLRKKYPDASITVLGYLDLEGEDSDLFSRMSAVHKVHFAEPLIKEKQSKFMKVLRSIGYIFFPRVFMPKAQFKELLEADLIVSKGQETLTESYGFVHFIDSMLEQTIASRVNKEIVLMGHSIGPVKKYRHLGLRLLNRMSEIQARDSLSLETIKGLNVTVRTTLVKDMAYAAVDSVRSELSGESISKALVIPNSALLHKLDKETYLARVSDEIEAAKKLYKEVVVLSSVTASGWNDDYMLCDEFEKKHRIEKKRFTTLIDLLQEISTAELVISSRLHPLILSDALGKNCIAISSAPKVKGMFEGKKKIKIKAPV